MPEMLAAEPGAEKGISPKETELIHRGEQDVKTVPLTVPIEEKIFAQRLTKVSRILEIPETPRERELETREITSADVLNGGMNKSIIIALKDDGRGLFKPREGELPLRQRVREGTYYLRERAAFLVSQFLGLDLVPPTVIREYERGEGSCQEFVPDAQTWHELTAEEQSRWGDAHRTELTALWLFDYIIWNTDRHTGNALFKGERVHAIDNGLSFGKDWPPLYLFDYYDIPIPTEVRQQFSREFSDEARENLKALLSELIPQEEVEASLWRIDQVRVWVGEGQSPPTRAQVFEFGPAPRV